MRFAPRPETLDDQDRPRRNGTGRSRLGDQLRPRRPRRPPLGREAGCGRRSAAVCRRDFARPRRQRTAWRLPAAVRARMRRAATLEEALDGAIHVQESTPEDVGVKRHVFARLDALAPAGAVLASSTSAILPSRFTEALPGRGRALVVHPINPPYLIPAVEVVPAPWTDAAVVERTAALMRSAGHAPIVMKREIDGFLMNRLQGALWRRRSGSSRKATRASRTWISAFATGSRSAGRSWARSRPSTSTRRAACATTPSAISGSMRRSSRRRNGGRTGPGR